jgi:hypothetical protein
MTKNSRRSVLQILPAALFAGRCVADEKGKTAEKGEAAEKGKGNQNFQGPTHYLVGPTRSVRNTAPNGLVALWPGPQLFVDDYLVLNQEGLAKTTHHPRRVPHPVVNSKDFGAWQWYLTVLRDPERNIFRMWYDAWVHDPGSKGATHLALAESKDGIEWYAPSFKILGDNNHVWALEGYGASIIDEGPAFADKARRFKMAYLDEAPGKRGLGVMFSPDGLRWKPYEKNPVLSGEYPEDDYRWTHSLGDTMETFWDPLRGRYGLLGKTKAIPQDGWQRVKASRGLRRLVSSSVSRDFLHWEMPWRIIVPEPRDEGQPEFVGAAAVMCRGGLLIGVARVLHDDYSADPGGTVAGIGYSQIITSRDGESWERHDDILLNRNLEPGTWDHAMSWISSQLIVGDETFCYYAGARSGHKVNPATERQIGLARMRRDGYVSRDAFGPDPGWLMTPLVKSERFAAFTVNAEASRGEVRVQVRDHRLQVVPGFSFAECTPLRGDGLQQQVRWSNATVNKLEGLPIYLEFRVTDARLYGFEFSKTAG